MPTDITITSPWNNPYNPYPFYSIVSLSANSVYCSGIETLELTNVVVATNLLEYTPINYPTVDNALAYDSNNTLGFGLPGSWIYFNITMFDVIAYLTTPRLALPTKTVGSAQGWVGTNVNDLYIQPDITQLTDWERRRRRLLENI